MCMYARNHITYEIIVLSTCIFGMSMCVCVCVCMCVCVCVSGMGGRRSYKADKTISDPLNQRLQVYRMDTPARFIDRPDRPIDSWRAGELNIEYSI